MSALEKINGILSGVDFSVFERAKALLAKPIDGDFSEFIPDASVQESQPVVSKRTTHRPPKKPVPKLLTDINDSLEMDEGYGAIAAAVAPLEEMHSQLMQKKRTSSKKGDIQLQSPTHLSPSAKGTPFSAEEERVMSIHHGHESVQSSSPSRHSRNALDAQTQFQKETQERLRKATEEKRQKQEQMEYDEYLDKKMKSRDEEERLERFRKETMKRLAQRKAELAHKHMEEEERKREEELAHKMAEQEAVERAQRATKDRLKNYRKVEPMTQERGRHEVSQTDSHVGSDRSTSPTPEDAERLERFRRETVKRLAERVSKLREENEHQKQLERERAEEAERRRLAEAEVAERARKEAAKRLSEFKKQCARQAQIEEEQRRREEEELVRKMKKKSVPLAQQAATPTTVGTDRVQSSNSFTGDVYTSGNTRNERFEKSNFVKQDRVVPKTKTGGVIGDNRNTISANGSLASVHQIDSYAKSDAELVMEPVSSPEDDHASLSSIDSLDRDDLMLSDQRKPPPAREIQSNQMSAHQRMDEANDIDLDDFDTKYTDAFDDAYADPFLNMVQPKFNISSEDFTSKKSKKSSNSGKHDSQSKKTYARPPKPVQPSSSSSPSLLEPKVELIRKVDTKVVSSPSDRSPKPESTPNRFMFDSPPVSAAFPPSTVSASPSASASPSVSSQSSFYKTASTAALMSEKQQSNQPQTVSIMNHHQPPKQKQKQQPSKDTFVWEEEDELDDVNSDLESDFDQMLSREISHVSKAQSCSRALPPPRQSKPLKPVQNMSKVIHEQDEDSDEEKWNENISNVKKRHDVESTQQRNGHSTATGSKMVQPKSYKETNKKQQQVAFAHSSSSPSTASLRSPSVRSVQSVQSVRDDEKNGRAEEKYGASKIGSTPPTTTTPFSSRNAVKKDVTPVWKRAPVPVHSTEYYMTQDKYKYTQQQLKKQSQHQEQHLPPFSNSNNSIGVTHNNGYSRRPQLDSRVSAMSDQPRFKHSIPPHLQLTVQRNVSSAPSPAPVSVPVYTTVDSPHSVDHLILNHHSSQHSIKPFIPPLEFVGRASPDDTSSIASSSRFSAQQPGSTYGQIHGKQSKSHPSQFFSEYATASVRSNTPPLRDISQDVRKRAFAIEEEEKQRQRSKESQVLSAVQNRTNMKARPVSYARVRR